MEDLSAIDKTTLGLNLPTDPRWVDIAKMNIRDILIDHAWCEQKAASRGISLIVNFAEKDKLLEVISPIVSEEWAHFRMVMNELHKRGIRLGTKRKDKYVYELNKLERKGGNINRQLMDLLLINALIEARSAERFKILAREIEDDGLKTFYHDLMISEAGHYRSYLDLAKEYMPSATVTERWQEMLHQEALIISSLGVREGEFH